MKLKMTENYSRCLTATNLKDEIGELQIVINYVGEGNAAKAIPLDNEVIPTIIQRVNAHDKLVDALKVCHERLAHHDRQSVPECLQAEDILNKLKGESK
jgi:hypothetical protein